MERKIPKEKKRKEKTSDQIAVLVLAHETDHY